MSQQPSSHRPDDFEREHPTPNTVAWYFYEFWPVMLFGGLFVLMVSVPLILSGAFAKADVFSSSDFVWAPYGLLIIAAFLVAWVITFCLPQIIGWYIFGLGLLALVSAEGWTATDWGKSLAFFFLLFVFLGNIYMFQVKKPRG